MDWQLLEAAKSGDLKVVHHWLDSSPAKDEINTRDASGATVLYYATKRGDVELVNRLLNNGAICNFHSTTGMTPLMLAVLHNQPEVAQLLINHGADLNAQNTSRGETALIMAVRRGNADLARILVDGGAETEVFDDDGYTAFDYAAFRQDNEMAQIIEHSNQSNCLRIILKFKNGKTRTFKIPPSELDGLPDLRELEGMTILAPPNENQGPTT